MKEQDMQSRERLLLLRAVELLGGITEDQLLRFLVNAQLMDPFTFLLTMGAMKEEGLVVEERRAGKHVVLLSEQGTRQLEEQIGQIDFETEQVMVEHASRLKRAFRDERQVPSEIHREGDHFRATLRALEDSGEFLSISITTDGRELAEQYCERWPRKAAKIYQTIIELLGEDD